MNNAIKKARTLGVVALAQAAQAGVARAVAAREAAVAKLAGGEIDQVSGGLVFPIIRTGGMPGDPGVISTLGQSLVLPAVQAPAVTPSIGMVM